MPISSSKQIAESLAVVASSSADIDSIFEAASRDAERVLKRLDAKSGVGAAVRRSQIATAREQLQYISSASWSMTGEQIGVGIIGASDLAATHALDMDLDLGMPSNAVAGYAQGMHYNAALAAEATIANKKYGFTLSERVYRNSQAMVARATRVVDNGLLLGKSAREIAKEVRGFISPDTPGGASYAAKRLARTEINNAYLAAQRDQYARRPWIDYVKWELSGSHPEPDPCDDLAEGGDHPKEAGWWKSTNVPDRPHPQCFCFITPVTPSPDKFLDDLVDGQYDDWLESQGLLC